MTTNVPLHELPWNPLSVAEVAARFTSFPGPWWIAGGWAIDLFIGSQTREHHDTDVLILRDDQLHLFDTLTNWEMYAAGMPEGLQRWPAREPFPPHVHDIWCRPAAGSPWALQLMLMDTQDDRWLFRRDTRIGGPIARLGHERGGIPYLAPEVQLLFKIFSKTPRPRDEADLVTALPAMSAAQVRWLRDALRLHEPGNPWIPAISSRIPG